MYVSALCKYVNDSVTRGHFDKDSLIPLLLHKKIQLHVLRYVVLQVCFLSLTIFEMKGAEGIKTTIFKGA